LETSRKKTKNMVILSLFVAISLILSYLEVLFPFSFGYGLKLGLANVAIISVLYVFSFKEALVVNLVRIFISGLLFGNVFSLIFSLFGGILSVIVMAFAKRCKTLSLITVSVLGAVSHNFGQLLAALIITKISGILFYMPVLLIGGIITGIAIGCVSGVIIKVLKEILKRWLHLLKVKLNILAQIF